MAKDGELWHVVEAKRADDSPAIFRIRELAPRLEQPQIFVAELPYPIADGSRLPDAASYRRFATFEEQWVDPACGALGWTPVAVKIEDGSFFIYLYGDGEPHALVERLSPFDPELDFFDEHDPTWDEYAALRELLEAAKAIAPRDVAPARDANRPKAKPRAAAKPRAKAKAKPRAKPKAKAKPRSKRR